MPKIVDAIRYDSATIQLVGPADEQFLRARVVLARTGVFPYVRQNGEVVREAKLPEHLFSDDTVESAKGIPVTLRHPPVSDNQGLVTTETYKKYARGSVGDTITHTEDELEGHETVWDSELMNLLRDGEMVEVSVGFRSKQVWEPGEFNGEKYDCYQTNIRFNHLAHVEKGRGGDGVRVYLDSCDVPEGLDFAIQTSLDSSEETKNRNGGTMKSKGSGNYSFVDKMRGFLSGMMVSLDSMEAEEPKADQEPDKEKSDGYSEPKKDNDPPKEDPAKKDSDSAGQAKKDDEMEVEMLKTRVQLLEKMLEESKALLEKAMSPAMQDSLAAKRLKLIEAAKAVKPEAKLDGMSGEELKALVINEAFGGSEVKHDSIDAKLLDYKYQAALELLREKANLRGEGNRSQASLDKADTEDIYQKRMSLKR